MSAPAMQDRITSLLEVLDQDVRHLEDTLSRLELLRSLLIKRENPALEKLLEDIRQQADVYQANEQKRQQLRRALAADLGCAEAELTLSKLQDELRRGSGSEALPDRQAALAERRARLRSLAVQLKREHALTVLLVRDCLRFNRFLLQAFFPSSGRGGTTYSPTGAARPETSSLRMSMQL